MILELNNLDILLLIISAVSVVFGAAGWIIPALTLKGVNVGKGIKNAGTVVNAADNILDTVRGVVPYNPALETLDKIMEYAKKGTEAAEQLYKTSQIEGEQRKDEAEKLVYQYLTAAGVEITEDLKKIIDGAIEAAVFTLPKTHAEIDA